MREGWFRNKNFGQYQKCNRRVVVYVERSGFINKVQLYYRGVLVYCELEARTRREDGIESLFDLGEIWLERYSDGNPKKICADRFHTMSPTGVWNNYEEKRFYLHNSPDWREWYNTTAMV